VYLNLDRSLLPKKNNFIKPLETEVTPSGNNLQTRAIKQGDIPVRPRKHQNTGKSAKKRISKQKHDAKLAMWRADLKQMFPITNYQLTPSK
jgi:hypothetical protein